MNKITVGIMGRCFKRGTLTKGFNKLSFVSDGYRLVIVKNGKPLQVELYNDRVGFIACYYFENMSDFKSSIK